MSKMCQFRLSETSADPESIFKLYKCVVSKTKHVDRLRFFRQVGEEIARVKSPRESPEIIALVADWGQGKTTFLSIVSEALNEVGKRFAKLNFVDVLKNLKVLEEVKLNDVVLIDEVESAIDFATTKYSDQIKEFWLFVKELANSKGNKVVYLSMTPSAYSKLFSNILPSMFPETYYSILQRMKRVVIGTPTKLEFLAMMSCLLDFNNAKDDVLKWMDLPFWTITPERRRYAKFFNDVVCNSYAFEDQSEFVFKGVLESKWLNEEEETIRVQNLLKVEEGLDKEEVSKFHKSLMARIFDGSLLVERLSPHVVKGFTVSYDSWREVMGDSNLDDFLLLYNPGKDFDSSLFVFVSEDMDKVLQEGVKREEMKKAVERLLVRKRGEAFAYTWNFFESLVNTNVGNYVVEFKSREVKERAIKFVNENLLSVEKELDGVISLVKLLNGEVEETRISDRLRVLKWGNQERKFTVALAKVLNQSDLESLMSFLDHREDALLDGLILVSSDYINAKDVSKAIIEKCDRLSITLTVLDLTTPVKRQLLYLLYYFLNRSSVELKEDRVDLRLGDVKRQIQELSEEVRKKVEVRLLPVAKGNKRPIQSLNWVIFNYEVYPEKVSSIFSKVNELVNEKFRIFGSKQFKLEDIETEESLSEIVDYLAENGIVNSSNGVVNYEDLAGSYLKEFAKTLSGYLRQRYGEKVEEVVVDYILFLAKLKEKVQLNLSKVFDPRRSSSVEFLIYASLATGEIARHLEVGKLRELLEWKAKELLEKLNYDVSYGYFITAKARGAGIRSLSEMKESMLKFKENAEKAAKGGDVRNYFRLYFAFFNLYSLYKDFLEETERARNKASKIKEEVEKKLEVIKEAKKLAGVRGEVEEEAELREWLRRLDENFDDLIKELSSAIQKANNKEFDAIRNLIEMVQKNSQEESNNLYLLVWEIAKMSLENYPLIFPQSLKETSLYKLYVKALSIGEGIKRLEELIREVNRQDPSLRKLKESVNKEREEISEVYSRLKVKLDEIAGANK
ncbi:MAG: hypothetical protein TQ35_0006275 [Candidatus Aramenus sulfurataquae]|uniref:Uncharacterized protein n=1 Tax=Candidatus Aramenus sulfurataquae TaxID=1326980 RepID=A0ACC6TPJ3_9CREN